MSRSEYCDDCDDQWALIRWRGAVRSAIRGARGQTFLREMAAALDAMPEKRLIADELQQGGAVCAIGAVGAARGLDMTGIDPEDSGQIARIFGIAEALAREVVYENDEASWPSETPETRFARMRRWVSAQITEAAS